MARKTINRPKIVNTQDSLFDIPPLKLNPRALGTKEEIIEYARRRGFINQNGCFDIQSLIEDNDELELIFTQMEEDGSITYNENTKKFIIFINKNQNIQRQRFTMLHEYIHYQVNRNIVKNNTHKDIILYRDETTRYDVDIYANQLASEILMPTEKFREAIQQNNGNLLPVAKQFNVSTLAVRYKAKSLGLNGHGL